MSLVSLIGWPGAAELFGMHFINQQKENSMSIQKIVIIVTEEKKSTTSESAEHSPVAKKVVSGVFKMLAVQAALEWIKKLATLIGESFN